VTGHCNAECRHNRLESAAREAIQKFNDRFGHTVVERRPAKRAYDHDRAGEGTIETASKINDGLKLVSQLAIEGLEHVAETHWEWFDEAMGHSFTSRDYGALSDDFFEAALEGRRSAVRAEQIIEGLEKADYLFSAVELVDIGVGIYGVVTAESPEQLDHASTQLLATSSGLLVEKLSMRLFGAGPAGIAAGLYVKWAISDFESFVDFHTALGEGWANSIESQHPGCGATGTCPNVGLGQR